MSALAVEVATRRCYRCEEELPIGAFAVDRSKGSGWKSICRSCDNAKSARYYEDNREVILARAEERAASKPSKVRICARCKSRPSSSSKHHYCDSCRVQIARRDPVRARQRERERAKVRATPTERGYGTDHQRRRRMVAPLVATGTVRCARGADCKYAVAGVAGLIRPGQAWDLGHDDDDRGRYRGPEHRSCNRATSGRSPRRESRSW